jgi:uncharacterized protein (DUF924 family)
MTEHYQAIIDFWMGDAASSVEALGRRNRFWFSADPKVDAEIRLRFGGLLATEAAEVYQSWKATPRGRLGLILLFDQFPRNVYRGTATAFAFDHKALALSRSGIDAELDRSLGALERMFFYMPLQHAEASEAQDLSVALFEALTVSCPPEQRAYFQQSLSFAREHRDLIARFGRFPHRNQVLNRESTGEETAYLRGGGKTFGQ